MSEPRSEAGADPATPALEARHLFKVFGRKPDEVVRRLSEGADRGELAGLGTAAVIDASFTVRRGEIYVVMGLSGSGKSTLIRMLNGLQEPSAGEVLIEVSTITGVSETELSRVRRSSVPMVLQHFPLLPPRTLLDNVAYPLEIQGVPAAERRERAMLAVERAGLAGWHEKMPDELSGGMRQRVGLARALAADTDIVLMDEAFSALDPLIRREMQEQLIELQHELGKTIVFITHDLNEAMFLGDRIAVMRDGRIVQIGTPEEILTDPANDYVAQFVQDVDRARVLTASAVMEPARSVVTLAAGPRAALRSMRDLQTSAAFVVGGGRRLLGTVRDRDVIEQVRRSTGDLSAVLASDVVTVGPDTALSEVIEPAVESALPVAVVDSNARVLGAIPRVTLLAALGNVPARTGEHPVIEPPATVSTEVVTATLHATGGPVEDAVLAADGGAR
ncbi:glycine betaine ABC transporter ATP-binding protein [Rathayibacter sp. AY2B7]|nr:glycine betaine ABC transporter ATP-binding protein [Rathayibacter sp. AY2B7]